MTPVPGLWRADIATGKTAPYIIGEPAQGQFTLVWGVHPLDDGSIYAFLATADRLPDLADDPNVVWPRFALVRVAGAGANAQKLGSATYENPRAVWAEDGSGALTDQYDRRTNTSTLAWLPVDGGAPVVIAQDISASSVRWGSR